MLNQTDHRVQIRVRIDRDALSLLDAEATRRNVSRDQIIRGAVDSHLSVETLHRYAPLLRDAFDSILQRHVDRLAKLSAKGARSAEATFYLTEAMMQMLDGINVEEATYEARKKASVYVRTPLTDEVGEYGATD